MNTNKERVNGDPIKHRKAADAANTRRKARVAKKAREAREAKIVMDILHEEALVMHKVWAEEQEMFNKAKEAKEAKEAKAKKGGMKVRVGLDEYPSLNAALRACDPIDWGIENAYRKSCWARINRNLKKFGEFSENGYKFELI